MQEALEAASRSRTTVCIAHRLSTIKNADKIIVISNGKVVEQGPHDDLYAQDGMYRGLVDAQRISAESTGDGGDETPEEVVEMEEALRRTRSVPDRHSLLRRSTTVRSGSIVAVENKDAGVVEQKKYSVFTLFQKVLTSRMCAYHRPSHSIKGTTSF